MDFAYLFTSFDGRIGRQSYWIGTIVMLVAVLVVFVVIGLLLPVRGAAILGFLLTLALAYPSAALMGKRLHDRNRPTWWVAFLLVPTILQSLMSALGVSDPANPGTLDTVLGLVVLGVGLWMLVELGILRGTQGPNQYGPDPLQQFG